MLALKRSTAFGAAVGVTLVLHAAAALGLAAVMGSPAPPDFTESSRPAVQVRWITALAPTSADRPTTADIHSASLSGAGVKGTLDNPPLAIDQRSPEFLGSDQVDEPARPALAWALDAEGLAALGIERIVFDTWVDAQASIAELRVIELQPTEAASLLPLVESRLAGTPMLAARKDGQPVAHQQRIELTLQPAAVRPG